MASLKRHLLLLLPVALFCDPRLNAVASLKLSTGRGHGAEARRDPRLNAVASLKRLPPKAKRDSIRCDPRLNAVASLKLE